MPDDPTTDNPTTDRRGARSYLERHPILAAIAALLPVLVAGWLQLRSGMVDIEQKQQQLSQEGIAEAGAAQTKADEIESKAGQLELETRKTHTQVASELQRLRGSISQELATVYSDMAALTRAVERLSARLDLIESETVDPETALRNEARVLFPDLKVDEMDAVLLRRLVDLFHGKDAATRLPPARKPAVPDVRLSEQDPVFLIAP